MLRRMKPLLVAFAMLLLLAGCRVDSTVTVDIERDGSGTVEVAVSLDESAAERVGDLAGQLQVEDLRQAGWDVTEPTVEDGLTWVRATKSFVSPENLGDVLDDIGAFEAVSLTRARAFGSTTWDLSGRIDVTGGANQFGDAELANLLGGRFTGVDIEKIETEERESVGEMFGLSFVVQMADDVESINAAETSGGEATWFARIDDVGPTPFNVASDVKDGRPRYLATIAGIAAAAGVVVLVLQGLWAISRRSRHGYIEPDPTYQEPVAQPVDQAPKRRRGAKAPPTVTQAATPAAAAAAATAAGATTMPTPVPKRRNRSGQPQLVVLDAMGVIYRHGNDVEDLLIPFVEDNGGTANHADIRENYRQTSLGRMTTAEFWAAVGVEGDAAQLDRAYLSQFRMTGGLLAFLDKLNHKKVPVACLSNDVSLWSRLLRQGFNLDTKIGPWIISGDIGARKPDPAIYEALRTTVGAPFDVYLFIDDRIENLDAARELGMRTALFAPNGAPHDTNGHRVVTGFNEFFRR